MTLIPVTINTRKHGTFIVTGEQVTPNFALTPIVAFRNDETPVLREGLNLTHIHTGLIVCSDSWIDMRKAAAELEELPIDWATLTKPTPEQAKLVRETYMRILTCAEYTGWPWPKWAGDESTPAASVLAGRLDDALRHGEIREKSRALVDEVTKLDKDLGRRLDTELLWRDCGMNVDGYSAIYLLAVLQRIDPTAADRAAGNLVRDCDAGDSLGEWVYQWRQELADRRPLTLHGFPAPAGLDGAQ
ncbi:hypothetical protein [Rhodococcus sp. YH1]|uniref:hypothetical protein n=1 Tax=Rhodococcus sp. YH1 TaxID=89066 RepID=UPI001386A2A7|nr:hypothetical protein [Rhodococcus sp. YH1]